MTASPYADSVAAIAAAWSIGWPVPAGVPVLWHHNGSAGVGTHRLYFTGLLPGDR